MELLNRIQRALHAPKGQTNKHMGFDYRSCEDILRAVKPLLEEGHLTIVDEIVLIGDRYYIKATATLTEGENAIQGTAYAREALEKKGLDVAQVTGAASSYARKYALAGLFAIDNEKDADTGDNREKKSTTKSSKTPPKEDIPPDKNKNMPDELRSKVREMIKEISTSTSENANDLLERITANTDKAGKQWPGQRNIEDITDKAANVVYGKVKDAWSEWKAKQVMPDAREEQTVECPEVGVGKKEIKFCNENCGMRTGCPAHD